MQASKELLKNEKKKLLNLLYKLIPLTLKVKVLYSNNYGNDDNNIKLIDNFCFICDLTDIIEEDINNDK